MLQYSSREPWSEAIGGPAPAPSLGSSYRQEPVNPRPRQGDEHPRCGIRRQYPTSAQRSDLILVLENAVLIESEPWKRLVETNSRYAELARMQNLAGNYGG